MTLWWLIGMALAAPPDRDAASLAVGSGTGNVFGLEASQDGTLVVGVESSTSTAFAVGIDGWVISTTEICAAGAVAVPQDELGAEVWVGCEDGLVYLHTYADNGDLELVEYEDTRDPVTIDLGEVSLLDLSYEPFNNRVYAVAEADSDGLLEVHEIDFDTLDVNVTLGGAVVLAQNGYVDSTLSNPNDSAPKLFVAHGADDVSTLTLGSSAATINLMTGLQVSVEGITASPNGIYAADASSDRIAEYLPSSQQWTYLTGLDVTSPQAVEVSWDTDDAYFIAAGETTQVWSMSGAAINVDDEVASFSVDGGVRDVAIGAFGYVLAGGRDGALHVLTANPWIADVSVDPAIGVAGQTSVVQFTPDEDVDYIVSLGEAFDDLTTELVSGSATAGETVEVDVEVDDSFAEGDNFVYIEATDAQGNIGYGRTSVFIDNPPTGLTLTDGNLGFADQALILGFSGIDDEDLSHYDVYVMTTEWSEDDWPTGGPTFDGADALSNPYTIEADPGADVSARIEPLTNGTTYYIAVRAVDTGGLEGPMSAVIQGTPQETYGASELAGETGGGGCEPGSGCSTSGGLATWLAGLVAVGLARRRRGLAGVAAIATLGLLATPAHAKKPWDGVDQTPTRGDFEIRYGAMSLNDPNLSQVYGESGNRILQMEFGPQAFRMLEVDVGLGFYQRIATTVSASGDSSAEKTMITWYPVSIDGTFRPQIFDEQLIVPFFRFGWDYILWNEKWDDGSGGKDKLSGVKTGTHWGVGGNLLLDVFSPARASRLEQYSGINDSYITVEYRRQQVGNDGVGLDFSGSMFTIGLKLDY